MAPITLIEKKWQAELKIWGGVFVFNQLEPN